MWAVGVAGTVLHFDGNVWTPVSISGPQPTQVMSGVWGRPTAATSGSSAPAASSCTERKAGLSPETSSVATDLTSVWGAGNNEVWAVGSRGTAIRRNASAATWSAQNHGLTQNILYGVWLSSRTDVWAVGDRVTLHYDGSGWAAVPNALEIGISVWGSADDDVWSVGRPVAAAGTPFISRFNGVGWVPASEPDEHAAASGARLVVRQRVGGRQRRRCAAPAMNDRSAVLCGNVFLDDDLSNALTS